MHASTDNCLVWIQIVFMIDKLLIMSISKRINEHIPLIVNHKAQKHTKGFHLFCRIHALFMLLIFIYEYMCHIRLTYIWTQDMCTIKGTDKRHECNSWKDINIGDIKGVIRRRKSQKDKQYNDQKDKQRSTTNYT